MKVNDYLKNLSVLYVEDEENIRETFEILLKEIFKNVYVAKNGKEGLELFKKYKPEIVITDIRMPIMDGIEMSKEIKKINPDTLIIIITAFSDIEYLKQAIEIGIDAYLTKPIELDKLFKKLDFFAEILKNKKEKEELFNLLQEIFNSQVEGILLIKNNNIILKNNAFDNFFKNPSQILNKIDLSKNVQELKIGEKSYKVNIKHLNSYTLISFIDITDYENQIFKDSLTNLYNRKIIPKIIQENKNLCLIIIDLDNFKKINDIYGHLTGDEVLKKISHILTNTLRKEDTIIRWGGEEFLVIIKNKDITLAQEIAEKVRKNIEKEKFDKIKKVTASLGVCCGSINNNKDFEKILESADNALYEAKRNGKNQVKSCKGNI